MYLAKGEKSLSQELETRDWQCSSEENKSRIDLLVDEVTVSVDEGTGKSVFIGRDNEECLHRDYEMKRRQATAHRPTSHCWDQTSRVG